MSRQIVVKRIAENEFYEAVTWYEEQQTGLGIRFAENVWKCFGRILENPRLFEKCGSHIARVALFW